MMLLSALFIISSGVIGLYASRYGGFNAGAAIVLACTGWFAIVFVSRSILNGLRRPA
jgi:ABC-type Mn2+/Zn2+ transport system permease subunit